MAEIHNFTGITSLDLEPEVILKAALHSKVQSALVIGYDEDGDLFFEHKE